MTTNISYYIREYIITTNIYLIHEMYFSLYEKMYNYNIYFYYIREYIIRNKYCHYIRECIMTTNTSLIHKLYFSLYKTMYNDNNYSSLYKKI